MRRFFLPPEALLGDEVSLPDEVLHHLRVLRLRLGAEVELLDGRGGVCTARLERLEKGRGTARVLKRRRADESAFPVHLLQGLPKGDKLELVLQKGVELGVSRFTPVVSGRSIPAASSSPARLQRWQRVVQEAARQSRRAVLSQFDPPCLLEEGLQMVEAPLRLMLWEEGAMPLRKVLPLKTPGAAAVLIGPEGGFSVEEAELAEGYGFVPVRLGPRVLRTETAGLAVATLLQYLYGDLDMVESGGGV